MAAHGLTILRQIRQRFTKDGAEAATRYAKDATNAPGTDIGSGFAPNSWEFCDRGDGEVGSPELLTLEGIDREIARNMHLDSFPCLEAYKEAWIAYVGTDRESEGYYERMMFFETRPGAYRDLVTSWPADSRAPVYE